MCDSIQPIPRHFDPWQFAKNHSEQHMELALNQTQELVKEHSDGVIVAKLRGYVDISKQSHLAGQVRVTFKALCQRCLEAMELPIVQDFDYVLIRQQEQENQVEGDFESLICPEPELDMAWFLEEEVLLAMPHISRHDDCTMPWQNDNTQETADTHRPFAALKSMLKS